MLVTSEAQLRIARMLTPAMSKVGMEMAHVKLCTLVGGWEGRGAGGGGVKTPMSRVAGYVVGTHLDPYLTLVNQLPT